MRRTLRTADLKDRQALDEVRRPTGASFCPGTSAPVWLAGVVAAIVLLAFGVEVSAQEKREKRTRPAGLSKRTAQAEAAAMPVGPKSPTGWYAADEYQNALQAAETLGRPLAIMYQDSSSTCPKHNNQRNVWLKARELSVFVRVFVNTNEADQVELLNKLRIAAGDKAGRFIPMLFLGTASGEYLGVVPYNTPSAKFMATIGEAGKTFGGVLAPKTAIACVTKLEQARTHWGNDNIDAALKCYRDIKRHESTNPKLPIFVEFRKDLAQIDAKGAEEVAAARVLFEKGEQADARTAVAEICRRYAGFKTADDARALRGGAGRRTAADTPEPKPAASEEPPIRTWTDTSGKHKIEASLVSVADDSVTLKNTSGKTFSVPLRRLSQDDREYARKNGKAGGGE